MDRKTRPSISPPHRGNLPAILSGCILAVWPIFINTSPSHLQARCGMALRDVEGRSAVYQASVPSMSLVEVTTAWARKHRHTRTHLFIHMLKYWQLLYMYEDADLTFILGFSLFLTWMNDFLLFLNPFHYSHNLGIFFRVYCQGDKAAFFLLLSWLFSWVLLVG